MKHKSSIEMWKVLLIPGTPFVASGCKDTLYVIDSLINIQWLQH